MSSTPTDLDATGLVADVVRSSVVDGPGHRYVVFLQGCNFDCLACHNPQTIPGHAPLEGHRPRHRSVADLLDDIRTIAPLLRGITVSGGEPTQQWHFVRSLFGAIKADPVLGRLTCFVDSNGSCPNATWDALAPVLDGAMIDLKSLDPVRHRALTGEGNDEVLSSIRRLHELGLLHEVRLLLVEGHNDDPELVAATARWLADLQPTMRIVLIGLRTHGIRPTEAPLRETSAQVLDRTADTLRRAADFELQVI